VKLSATQRFSVLDLPSSKVDHVAKAKASQAGRDKLIPWIRTRPGVRVRDRVRVRVRIWVRAG
jgi:predicted XRE-type DNA-binding protein